MYQSPKVGNILSGTTYLAQIPFKMHVLLTAVTVDATESCILNSHGRRGRRRSERAES